VLFGGRRLGARYQLKNSLPDFADPFTKNLKGRFQKPAFKSGKQKGRHLIFYPRRRAYTITGVKGGYT
jgi:hypothetical protein